MANFEALGAQSATSSSHLQPHYIHMSATSAAVPQGMSLLEVDVSGLIRLRPEVVIGKPRTPPGATKPFGGTGSPRRPGTHAPGLPAVATKKTSGSWGEAAALATALSTLHLWRLDDAADRQMVGMVASLGLLGDLATRESPKSPAGLGQPSLLPPAPSIGLVQVSRPYSSCDPV
jgi:hypothetical protein